MAAPQPATEAPPSAQVVGNAFVQQYYSLVLHQSHDLVCRFYQDASRLARPSASAGAMDSVTTMEAISEKIMGMDIAKAEIRTVDSQESLGGGVTELVTGHLTGRDGVRREFAQSFFLAPQPQEKGYFVLNDMFRYAAMSSSTETNADAAVPPVAPVPEHDAAPLQEQHVVGRLGADEEVYNPPPEEAVDEEQPIPEVINQVPNNVATTVSPVSQKKVKDMEEVPLPAPTTARPAPPKPVKQSHARAPFSDAPAPPFTSNPENSNIQDPKVDLLAIYVRNLPLNATEAQLEDEFKKFGTVKQNGIQVRSNKVQGFCYGFVEFEDASAVQSAIEASPVTIGSRQCYVQEKRTPGARGPSRGCGRFALGRGNNSRNEGMRGRGNYSGGRRYGRGEFSYRSDYGGRGSKVPRDSQKQAEQCGEERRKGQVPPPETGGPCGSSNNGRETSTFRFNPRSADDIFAEFFGFSGIGGTGGTGGGAERGMRGSRFGIFGDDIFGSFPQFPGKAAMHVPQRPQKAPPIEHRLPFDLADLYKGTTKKMKVSRQILDAGGRTMVVEEIVTINIKPGWKKGTKITFPERGNQAPHIIPADIVFIIDEKPHDIFTRDGNDLVMTWKISLVEILNGCTIHVTTLDGRNLTVPINSVIYPSYEEVVPQEGMPIPKDPSKKGNLRIKFSI